MTLFLALALLHKLMSILLPIFVLPLLGFLSGVKPHLKLLALVIPYSGNPKVRYYIVFRLGPFHTLRYILMFKITYRNNTIQTEETHFG